MAAIGRLTQIIERFETRIDKLGELGVDTDAASAKLIEAAEHLVTAADIVENQIDDLVDATVDSENPRETWQAARELFGEGKTEIQAAHADIREALALLKEAVAAAELERGVSEAVRNENSNDGEEEEDVFAQRLPEKVLQERCHQDVFCATNQTAKQQKETKTNKRRRQKATTRKSRTASTV